MSYYSDIFGRAADTGNDVEAFAAGKAAANSGTSQPATVGPVNSIATNDVEAFAAGKAAANSSMPVLAKPTEGNPAISGDNGRKEGKVENDQDGGGDNGGKEVVMPTYLADWAGGTTFTKAIQDGKHSIAEYIGDYNKYAAENGGQPLDIFEMMTAIQGRDVNKSVAQNQADEKKRIREERFQQIGNVLQHLGNFVGTMVGAPSQTIESGVELSKRQQILRDKTLQERAAYNQNLLAQIWKQRADDRAAEKNNADIGLIRQRIEALENDNARKEEMNQANILLASARQQQAEEAAGLNKERAETERQMRDPKIANVKSSTNAHNASAAASNASTYGTNYRSNRHAIWAKNKRQYPNDFKEFMTINNIHGWDSRNWSSELIDQFNAWIADKYEKKAGETGNSSSGSAADLLD